jgi:hypothetical protein
VAAEQSLPERFIAEKFVSVKEYHARDPQRTIKLLQTA